MMPELGMDMFDADMAAVPGMPDKEPEEEVLPPPEETMVEPVQATDAGPLYDVHAAAAQAVPDQGVHMTGNVHNWLAVLSDVAGDLELCSAHTQGNLSKNVFLQSGDLHAIGKQQRHKLLCAACVTNCTSG